MKKYIVLLLSLFTIMVDLQAQTVSYTYRPLSAEGCTVSYTPSFVGDTAYIVVSVQSDRLVFSDNPTMMVRFFNTDQILQLEGKKLDATSSEGGCYGWLCLCPYFGSESNGYVQGFRAGDGNVQIGRGKNPPVHLADNPRQDIQR